MEPDRAARPDRVQNPDACLSQKLTNLALNSIERKKVTGLELIRAGVVDVNSAGSLFGERPLGVACYHLWLRGVRELLKLGANPWRCADNVGNAALSVIVGVHDAIEAQQTRASVVRDGVAILALLLEYDDTLLEHLTVRSVKLPLVAEMRIAALEHSTAKVASALGRLLVRSSWKPETCPLKLVG